MGEVCYSLYDRRRNDPERHTLECAILIYVGKCFAPYRSMAPTMATTTSPPISTPTPNPNVGMGPTANINADANPNVGGAKRIASLDRRRNDRERHTQVRHPVYAGKCFAATVDGDDGTDGDEPRAVESLGSSATLPRNRRSWGNTVSATSAAPAAERCAPSPEQPVAAPRAEACVALATPANGVPVEQRRPDMVGWVRGVGRPRSRRRRPPGGRLAAAAPGTLARGRLSSRPRSWSGLGRWGIRPAS